MRVMETCVTTTEIRVVEENADFARGQFDQLQIDLLLTRNPLFEKVRRAYATTQPFVERVIPCATVEGLLLLKLYALPSLYRHRNFARVGIYENDIATLMQIYQPALAPLLTELGLDPSQMHDIQVRYQLLADTPAGAFPLEIKAPMP